MRHLAIATDENHGEILALKNRLPTEQQGLLTLTQPEDPLATAKTASVYTKNSSALFPPVPAPSSTQGQQDTPAALKAENPLEDLRSIRQEMATLANEMDRIRSQFALLEQRATRLETSLGTSHEKGATVVLHTN